MLNGLSLLFLHILLITASLTLCMIALYNFNVIVYVACTVEVVLVNCDNETWTLSLSNMHTISNDYVLTVIITRERKRDI